MTRTVPVLPTEVPGNFSTAALFNVQTAAFNYLLTQPAFSGYQGSVQTLTTAVWGAITLDQETVDSDGGHSTVTNTSRYTCQVAGWYLVWGVVAFANNVTGLRASKIFKNGAAILGGEGLGAPGATVGSTSSCFTSVQLAVGDYIELYAFQQSGGNLATLNNGEAASTLTALWVRS